MKQPRLRVKNRTAWLRNGVVVLVMVGAGLSGMRLLGISSAATTYNHNPVGAADYCVVEGASTVLYGWSHDPDAPAGSLPSVSITVGNSTTSVSTGIAGYRDAAINSYIANTYPGEPTSSIYGWRLAIGGLYKGNSYSVSGIAINYGTGVNTGMNINSTTNVGGNIFTSSKTLPDACLLSPPIPSPTPSPTPTPTPTPSKTPPKSSGKQPTTPATSTTTPSNAADATVTVGTSAASLLVPAGSATTLHVVYGVDPNKFDQTSLDQATNGNDTTVVLTGLSAKTSYSFQIVRTQDSQTVNSASSTFVTKGYDLTLLFQSNGQPVQGMQATLGPSKATSDKDGKLSFTDLSAGTYTPSFRYKGHTHTQSFNTYATTPSDKLTATTLQKTINLDQLSATSSTTIAPSKQSPLAAILISIFGLLLLGFGLWFFWRRRSRASSSYAIDTSMPAPLPMPLPNADIIDQQSHHAFSKQTPPPEPAPENMGKSLREMVLESMRQEAAKRKDQQPPER